jgi:hypothetical protein
MFFFIFLITDLVDIEKNQELANTGLDPSILPPCKVNKIQRQKKT